MLKNTAARITILMTIFYVFCTNISGQNVGIGTATPAAKLDVTSTNSGILIPRVSLQSNSDVTTVPSPIVSTIIYNTANAGTGTAAVSPGFYYWNGSQWVRVIDSNSLTAATMVSNSISGNNISTTVDGVTGTPVAMPNIYTSDGTLAGNRTVTMSGNTLGFTGGNVGVGNSTPNGQAILDLSNTSNYALVLPQIATAGAPSAPTKGMTFYNSTTNCLQYWNGSVWVNVANSGGASSPTTPTWVTNPVCASTSTSYVFNSVSGSSYLVTFTGAGNTVNGTNATSTPLTITASAATTTLSVTSVVSGTLSVSLQGCNNTPLTQAVTPYGNNVLDVSSTQLTSITTTAANEIIIIDYGTYKSNAVTSPPSVSGCSAGVPFLANGANPNNGNVRHYDWYYLAPTAGTYSFTDAGNLSNYWGISNIAIKNSNGCPLSGANVHQGSGTGWNSYPSGGSASVTTASIPAGAFLAGGTNEDGGGCGTPQWTCSPQTGWAATGIQNNCDGDGDPEQIGGVTVTTAGAQTVTGSNSSGGSAFMLNVFWIY